MPYIGRELDRGNYLKLDDISSSFDGSTTTFNLTNGGNAFYPGSAFSILVVLAGVVQEPEAAYQINQAQITFASAPLAGDQFFCIVLGQALGVNTPANGSVNGTQLAKPFNYDNYFYLDDANNRVGVGTATPMTPLHVEGTGRFTDLTVTGDLTVEGTTTTLDTVVTEVDKLEVAANNNTVGVAITQSGSGDAAIFMGGNVGIGTDNPQETLEISKVANHGIRLSRPAGGSNPGNFDIRVMSHGGGNLQASRSLILNYGSNGLNNQKLDIKSNTSTVATFTNTSLGIGTETPRSTLDIESPQFDISENINASSSNQSSGLLLQHDGGELPGDAGAGIKFAQRWFGGSTDNIVTAGIFGYKRNASGNFGGGLKIATSDQTANRLATRVTIDDSGSVGIGSDSPQSRFEVYGTSPIIRSKHSTSQKYTQINHDGTDGYLDWSSGHLIFRGASNTERLRITSGGALSFTGPGSIQNEAADSVTMLSGGTASNSGANIVLYGQSHASEANVIRLRTGTTDRLRITSAGYVGINQTSPDKLLHISSNSNPTIRIENTSAGAQVGNLVGSLEFEGQDNNAAGVRAKIDAEYRGVGGATAIKIHTAWENETTLYESAYFTKPTIKFTTNNVERLRIASDGDVGIGTNNPLNKLDVRGGISVYSPNGLVRYQLGVHNSDGVGLLSKNETGSYNTYQIDASTFKVKTTSTNSPVERFRITSGGNIGVGGGTGTDFSLLDGIVTNTANGSAGLLINSSSSSHNAYMSFGYGSGSGTSHADQFSAYIGRVGDDTLVLGTNNNIRVRIESNGRIAVGGFSGATHDLHIKHSSSPAIKLEDTTQSCILQLYAQNSNAHVGTHSQHDLIFNTNTTERLRISASGNVGIGTDNPQAKLHVDGTIHQTGIEYPSFRPTLDLNFAATKVLDDRIIFTRDSVGTYTDDIGIVRTAPNNTPRFDHDPATGESLGLLIEESRTNLFTYSEAFNTSWTNIRSSDSGTTATADPEGNTTGAAYKLVANTDNNTHRLDKTGLSMSTSTTYTMSVWAKAAEYTGVSLTIADSSNASHGIYFDLSNGTFTNGGNAHRGSMIKYPNGWYRCIATYTTPASITWQQCLIGVLEDGTTKSYAGNNSSGIYIWGAQLEQGSFATSYIYTPGGSTKTRTVDTAKITGTNFTDFYNQTEGTFFVEADTINPVYTTDLPNHDGNNNNYTIVGTGDSPNRFQLRFDDAETYQVLGFGPNSTNAITTNIPNVSASLRAKIAGAVKQNDVRGAAQGQIILTDTSFDMISPTSLFIGSLNGSSEILPGHVRKVSYYRQALSNAQLQGLTQQ